ncbi:MAG: TROVE domain-containing protein [Bacteroidota bacterium]
MSLFNLKKKSKRKITNRAGAMAYKQSPEYRLVTLLLTNFLQRQFYRKANQSAAELLQLSQEVDAEFVAKAAVYARHEFGMRSVTHLLAAALAKQASGQDWGKSFYDRIVRRPDDMLEIVAAYQQQSTANGKLTNAMRKGFAKAFDRFDGYQLAKYRGDGREFKLVDLVNLVRPVPTQRNARALAELVEGKLRNTQTWESKLTAAGQTDDQQDAKKAAWMDLLVSNKLGYFALLRNLRNILSTNPEAIGLVREQLTDEKRIKTALVLPFRLLTAYKELSNFQDAQLRRLVLEALEVAIERSCANLPELNNSLVVVDNSGSMQSPVAGSPKVACSELGALFGMALARRSNADLMEFGTTARMLKYRLRQGILEFSRDFAGNNRVGHGTNFDAIFAKARKAYDRIIIFSDMQSGLHRQSGNSALLRYRMRTGSSPTVYTINLRGYGTSHFSPDKIIELAGFSEKLFDLMAVAEQDPEVLLNAIRGVEW